MSRSLRNERTKRIHDFSRNPVSRVLGNYKTSHIHHQQHQTELAGYFGTIQKGKETITKEAFLEAAACLQSNGDEIQVESDKIKKDEFVKLLKEKTF